MRKCTSYEVGAHLLPDGMMRIHLDVTFQEGSLELTVPCITYLDLPSVMIATLPDIPLAVIGAMEKKAMEYKVSEDFKQLSLEHDPIKLLSAWWYK